MPQSVYVVEKNKVFEICKKFFKKPKIKFETNRYFPVEREPPHLAHFIFCPMTDFFKLVFLRQTLFLKYSAALHN